MAIEIVDWDKHYENNRTRDLKQMQWVPMPNRQDGDGYTELVDHPNGAAHFGIWCALVQVASRCDPRGTLLRDSAVPHDCDSLARMTRLPIQLWQEALPRLLSIGWIRDCEIPQEGATIPHPSAMNGMEWNGKNGMEKVSTPDAPALRTKPALYYDFTTSLWHGISDEQVALWAEAYPAVDVDLELRQMGEWCKSNGARGKKQDWKRFIVNWLKRSQDRGGSEPKGAKKWKR
mgnify:CR=1 FL=1